jgi:hypothetical protein
MRTTYKTLAVIITFMLVSNIFAQETSIEKEEIDLLQFYDSELIKWDYSFFGGLKLSFRNRTSGTFFGVNDLIRFELIKYLDVYDEFNTYRIQRNVGNILLWGGIALILCDFFAFAPRDPDVVYEPNLALFGFQLALTSPVFFILGKKNLFDSVNLYNRHKINEYNRPLQR